MTAQDEVELPRSWRRRATPSTTCRQRGHLVGASPATDPAIGQRSTRLRRTCKRVALERGRLGPRPTARAGARRLLGGERSTAHRKPHELEAPPAGPPTRLVGRAGSQICTLSGRQGARRGQHVDDQPVEEVTQSSTGVPIDPARCSVRRRTKDEACADGPGRPRPRQQRQGACSRTARWRYSSPGGPRRSAASPRAPEAASRSVG